MPAIRRLALVLLACACSPAATSSPAAPTPAPAPASAPAAAAPETCLLGDYRVLIQQRMVQDSGETALLEDQRVAEVPVLFAAQRQALRDSRAQDASGSARPRLPNAPQTLLLLVGAQVTETLDDLEYVPHPDGAKPTSTRTTSKPYTFFLADAAWDCAGAAAEIAASKLPQGQVGAAACVPAPTRARCTPVDLAAR